MDQQLSTRIGVVLGGAYRLERMIGEGGFGSVYEASHLRVPRRFAVKLLSPEVAGNREIFDRFAREAQIASSLGEEHIVQAFDFNHTDDGVPYIVLEFLEGEDLAKRLATRGPMSVAEAAHMMEQAASALTAAHRAGIVHRDLKPQNIFLCRRGTRDDYVKLLDFGISKVLHSPSVQTRTGMIFGTPNYMSPEQAEGRQSEIDQRSDIFSLGAILYECLSGRLAFQAATVIGTVYQVCHTDPDPLTTVAQVPETVARAIERALAKSREARWQSVAEFRDAFALACSGAPTAAPSPRADVDDRASAGMSALTLLQSPGTTAPPTTLGGLATSHPTKPPHSSRRWLIAGALVGAVAVVVVGLIALLGQGSGIEPPNEPSVPAAPVAAELIEPDPESPPPSAPPAPSLVEVTLVLTPASATVEIDGKSVAGNPLRLPRSNGVHQLAVGARGYVTERRELRADGSTSSLAITLKAAPKEPSVPPRDRKKPKAGYEKSPIIGPPPD